MCGRQDDLKGKIMNESCEYRNLVIIGNIYREVRSRKA